MFIGDFYRIVTAKTKERWTNEKNTEYENAIEKILTKEY